MFPREILKTHQKQLFISYTEQSVPTVTSSKQQLVRQLHIFISTSTTQIISPPETNTTGTITFWSQVHMLEKQRGITTTAQQRPSPPLCHSALLSSKFVFWKGLWSTPDNVTHQEKHQHSLLPNTADRYKRSNCMQPSTPQHTKRCSLPKQRQALRLGGRLRKCNRRVGHYVVPATQLSEYATSI